jgi:hypothetical protein
LCAQESTVRAFPAPEMSSRGAAPRVFN